MRNPTYSKYIKPGSFIDLYMEYMKDLETPVSYDFWTALWIISTIVGRNTVIARPRIPVFLNLYTILVAESGTTRKSTAVTRASNIVQEFFNRQETPVVWLSTRTTPETIEALLHNHTHLYNSSRLVIAVSELVRLLGKEKYNAALPGLLTDLYDCPETLISPGTIMRGPTAIKNVYTTILAACAPSWLVRSINPDVVEGGFTSRVLFIVSNKRKQRIAWPSDSEFDTELIYTAMEDIVSMSKRVSQINLTQGAINKLSKWYRNKQESVDPYRSSFEAREDDHVLRIAGLLSISDNRWQIERTDIANAIECVRAAKAYGALLFEDGGTADKTIQVIDKIRTKFLELGADVISQTELYQYVRAHITASRLRVILAVMHEMKLVTKAVYRANKAGPATTYWRGTQRLISGKVSELIAKEYNRR